MRTSFQLQPQNQMNASASSVPLTESSIQTQKSVVPESIRLELFNQFTGLAVSIANQLIQRLPTHVAQSYRDDFTMIAFESLWLATSSYSEAQSLTFPAYVAMRMRGAVLDELRRTDHMPRRIRLHVRQAQRRRSELEQTQGRDVSLTMAAQTLGVSRDIITKISVHSSITFVSLDKPVNTSDSDGGSIGQFIPDENTKRPGADLDTEDNHLSLEEALAKLEITERSIIRMYHYNGIRLTDIALCLGLTESRVCQIHAASLVKLRRFMKRN